MACCAWYRGNQEWPHQEIDAKDGTYCTWLSKVFFSNILHFIAGLLSLTNSFVIILQSGNVIDLFKDFTALILISEIDNLVFSLASKSYFGEKLKDETEKINKIQLVDDRNKQKIRSISVCLIMFFTIFTGMVDGWSYFLHAQ